MAWHSLNIEAKDNTAELISETLMELGALSASIEDAHAETPDEQPIFGEPGDPPPGIWCDNIVSALLDIDVDIPSLMQALEQATGLSGLPYQVARIEEQDWVRATQSQFDPIKIRDDLWIVPSWHQAPNPQAINIILDPGLAFGTGSHPTTHLCLDWLATHLRLGETVLDYGCGSGILAIAAKKLGASTVVGVDIDPQAVVSSRYNATENTVDVAFFEAESSRHQAQLPVQYDVVVANILSSALTVLAPALASACRSGGRIALSGILQEQVDRLMTLYSEWFDMQTPVTRDGWYLLTGTKKG